MAFQKLTDKTALTTAASDDLMHIVDVSDTTGSAAGTSKKITVSDLSNTLGGTQWVTMQGAFFQNNTTFAYWPLSGASTSESSFNSYLNTMALPVAMRLVDVTLWAQSGSARNETINVYNFTIAGAGALIGSVTASVTAGQATRFVFDTSTFDYAALGEAGLGWTPNTAPNGCSFTARYKIL